MKKTALIVTILFLSFASAGCGTAPAKHAPGNTSIPRDALAEPAAVKEKLYVQYRQWKGTPYKIEGMSKEGVDCSGMVYITYREQLGIELPRTTELQSQVGREIKRSKLQAGDLVFFKTGVKVRHVGIYIENGKFLHASTKKGVIISRLSDYYWKGAYWHSRRIM